MSAAFSALGVSDHACRALSRRGIEEPFEVQELVISDVLAGDDVLVQSPTGSGKTLAFGLGLLERIEPGGARPSALVLAPTRELASQIVDELQGVADALEVSMAPVYGGVSYGPQIKRARRADLIVATPGRLEDLLQRGDVELGDVDLLVLDEADRMLDMGFRPAVDRIVARTRADRQTLFFSATLAGAAGSLAARYTSDARRHVHDPESESLEKIEHSFVRVPSPDQKVSTLVDHLKGPGTERTLVFVRTKRGADRLVKRLGAKQVTAAAMHGNKTQSQRRRALTGFERGEIDTLVATDVAARGIDVEDISQVINFDIPGDHETYTHRVGRTGRAGRSGAGISFVMDEERDDMRKMAAALGLGEQLGAGLGEAGPGGQASGGRSRRRSRRGSRGRSRPQRSA